MESGAQEPTLQQHELCNSLPSITMALLLTILLVRRGEGAAGLRLCALPQGAHSPLPSCLPVLPQGGAPQGVKFVDYEEVWRINEATGQGEWVPVTE